MTRRLGGSGPGSNPAPQTGGAPLWVMQALVLGALGVVIWQAVTLLRRRSWVARALGAILGLLALVWIATKNVLAEVDQAVLAGGSGLQRIVHGG